MAIDFEIPEDAKAMRERVRRWVHEECIPAEKRLVDRESFKVVLAELRAKARAQGLWSPFIPKEHGGIDTPLAAWYTHIRSQRLVDGPDEVHRWTTGRNVIRAFERDGTTAAAAGGDLL